MFLAQRAAQIFKYFQKTGDFTLGAAVGHGRPHGSALCGSRGSEYSQCSFAFSTTDEKSSPVIDTSGQRPDRKSTRLNSSHVATSYAVFCLKQTTCHDRTHVGRTAQSTRLRG